MPEPHEPTPDGGAGRAEAGPPAETERTTEEHQALPPPATGQPATGQPATGQPAEGAPPPEPEPVPPPAAPGGAMPPPGPAGHYVFVPAGMQLRGRGRFGPGFGRFARHRATQLVAAVVVGALVGGGTVALVDSTHRPGPERAVAPYFRDGQGGQFGPGRYHLLPNQGFDNNQPGQGGQGPGG